MKERNHGRHQPPTERSFEVREALAEDLTGAMKQSCLGLSDEDVMGLSGRSKADLSGWGDDWAAEHGGHEFVAYILDQLQT